MSIQTKATSNSRGLRVTLFAFLAVAALAAAAFWFGTGLRADTSASVAPSPLGSSLTNVRESLSVAPSPLGSSLTNFRESRSVARSPLGSSLTAVRTRPSEDYVDRLINSSAAATSASRAAIRFADRYDRMSSSSAAASAASVGLSSIEYARKYGIPAAAPARSASPATSAEK